MKIYKNSNISELRKTSHPVFQAVETEFNKWIDSQDTETKEKYFSEEAIYTVKGAIRDGIEYALDTLESENKPFMRVNEFDFWEVWES